jgi:hypothetical protein
LLAAPKLQEVVAMFTQNDWWLKQMAEERINTQLQEAEATRLAKLATRANQQGRWVQHSLARFGKSLSGLGDYLQAHFGVDPKQLETDYYPEANISKNRAVNSTSRSSTELPC